MITWALALTQFGSLLASLWNADGVSEFVAALMGGGFALAAQQMAVRHDRQKAEELIAEEAKGHAWAIFFKLNEINEVIGGAARQIADARARAKEQKLSLWQTLQFPPHDHREFTWETRELVLLIDHRKLDLMTRYQEATVWLANFIQSAQLYRQMRVDFLTSHPSTVTDDHGEMNFSDKEYKAVMPLIAHLSTLAESLDEVVTVQSTDRRSVLEDYVVAMKEMIGQAPQMEFTN